MTGDSWRKFGIIYLDGVEGGDSTCPNGLTNLLITNPLFRYWTFLLFGI